MTDHELGGLDDHVFGVELQINELVEQHERAVVQGRDEKAEELQHEIEELQDDLVVSSELIADEHTPS